MRVVTKKWVLRDENNKLVVRTLERSAPPQWLDAEGERVEECRARRLEFLFQEDVRAPEMRVMCKTCRTVDAMFRSTGSTHSSVLCDCAEAHE